MEQLVRYPSHLIAQVKHLNLVKRKKCVYLKPQFLVFCKTQITFHQNEFLCIYYTVVKI